MNGGDAEATEPTMASEQDKQVIREIRTLYKNNEWARILFDRLGERKNNSHFTKIEVFAKMIGASVSDATAYAKELQDTGCGSYTVGRRGNPSRIAWHYNAISLGQAAAGHADSIIRMTEEELEAAEREDEPAAAAPLLLTIPQAKEALARTFGVTPDKIEIIVKA